MSKLGTYTVKLENGNTVCIRCRFDQRLGHAMTEANKQNTRVLRIA